MGALSLGLVTAMPALAEAQSLSVGGESANFGTYRLRGGFRPDPKTIGVRSGGGINAAELGLGEDCTGFLAREPDAILHMSSADDFLRIFFEANSDGDATLVINDPSGNWRCNDDAASGVLHPAVDFRGPGNGQYDIWVGSYEVGSHVNGTLSFTELPDRGPSPGGGSQPNLVIGGESANFGVHNLTGGFDGDPRSISVTSGGDNDASDMNFSGTSCAGYVTRRPDMILNYRDSADMLRFFVRPKGSGDTTLIINDANGNWHCNDDFGDGVNPMVSIDNPGAGQYDVWIGSYRSGIQVQAGLYVTELADQTP